MPWAPQQPSPPPAAVMRVERPSNERALLDALEKQAVTFPEIALAQAARIRREDQRDRVQRIAFLTAASQRRDVALRYLEKFADRRWLGEVAFHDAVRIAGAAGADPAAARRLLLASALRNPGLAVRSFDQYLAVPGGREVFDEAALAAADEVVPLAVSNAALREALAGSARTEVRLLDAIARREGIAAPLRSRIATLARTVTRAGMSLDDAERIAGSPARYFAALVEERLQASGTAARGLDRILENYALTLCRAFQESPSLGASELSAFSTRDLYLLLGYGRAEQEDRFFTGIFDRVLLPKLRALPRPRPLARLVEQTKELRFRAFASTAILFERWERFVEIEGSDADRTAFIGKLARGIERAEDPLEDAVTVSEILELTNSAARLRLLSGVVSSEFAQAGAPARSLYGVLAGRIQERLGSTADVRGPGARYAPMLRGTATLDTRLLFDEGNICRQRYFFYYDQDGVDSFQTFLMAYEDDPAWRTEVAGGVARITGAGADGLKVLIFANEPFDLLEPVNAGREAEAAGRGDATGAALRESGGEARVLVHRGHSYHADKTLDHVTRGVQLVFLGSCRGLGSVHRVLEVSQAAHVFATRGIGTQEINDPLLKNLNTELLRGGTLDWAEFWRKQEARLGNRAHFRDYLPPHRNPASILLRAYYRALDEMP